MQYQTLVIINPHSGNGKAVLLEGFIEQELNASLFDYTIVRTEYAGHAKALAFDAVKRHLDLLIVIGGDGTVNEVLEAVKGSNTKLAIIPRGSGNGLARTLKIPMNPHKAIDVINQFNIKQIDLLRFGKEQSVNVAGVGFDAHIADCFSHSKRRGFITYIKMTIAEFFKYQVKEYCLDYEGKQIKVKAFLIAFANSVQFGNNAYIAPLAKMDDGLMDVCILKPFPIWAVPKIAFQVFTKKIHHSKYYESFKTEQVSISAKGLSVAQVDGEMIPVTDLIEVSVQPKSVQILIPN